MYVIWDLLHECALGEHAYQHKWDAKRVATMKDAKRVVAGEVTVVAARKIRRGA